MKIREVHIISHTHWDREWFVESEISNPWLVPLFGELFKLLRGDSSFRYVLDGQMLMVEDYLNQLSEEERSKAEEEIRRYAKEKRLLLGPFYVQQDLRVVGQESIVRNIEIGLKLAREFGEPMMAGWLVDCFGYPSQIPQVLRMFGINCAFVWRGVRFPKNDIRTEFWWESPDGSRVLAVYMPTSYRNLMRISETLSIAKERVVNEVKKLAPLATTDCVALYNGYDLEVKPENPMFYLPREMSGMKIMMSDPETYAKRILEKSPNLYTVKGYLYSGKYFSVFPGALSSRIYLKVLNRQVEHMLTDVLEPTWAFLAACGEKPPDLTEVWKRLLENQPHDNICGVGTDPVAWATESRLKALCQDVEEMVEEAVAKLASDLKPGVYVFNTNDTKVDRWIAIGRKSFKVWVEPFAVMPVYRCVESSEVEENVEKFSWENDYYVAKARDGKVKVVDKRTGKSFEDVFWIEVEDDEGDEYNFSPGAGGPKRLEPATMLVTYWHDVAALTLMYGAGEGSERALIYATMIFENSPIIRLRIRVVNSLRGKRISAVFRHGGSVNKVFAGAPFAIEERPLEDTDLGIEDVPQELRRLFIGAREVWKNKWFPMLDFVLAKVDGSVFGVFARGLFEYEAERDALKVTLLRSVEWVARGDLKTRIGDAGPKMYVPGATCTRGMELELGFGAFRDEEELLKLARDFVNPPIVFEVVESEGSCERLGPFIKLSLTNAQISAVLPGENGRALVRVYNPTDKKGEAETPDFIEKIPPYTIRNLSVAVRGHERKSRKPAKVRILYPKFSVDVGEDSPIGTDAMVIRQLLEKSEELLAKAEKAFKEAGHMEEEEKAKKTLEGYAFKREGLEVLLSALQNLHAVTDSATKKAIEREIREVAQELNITRIYKRMYEYIVDFYAHRGG